MRPGSSHSLSELLRKGTLPLFKFDVNGIGLGSGKPIALHAPREEVKVDMRHCLSRCGTVLHSLHRSDIKYAQGIEGKTKKKKRSEGGGEVI
jgi:hypothetical protein